MSRSLIVRLFSAIDSCDWTMLINIFHQEVVYERPGYESFNGLERVLYFYQEERIVLSGNHFIEGIVVDGAYAACWGCFYGIGKNGDNLSEKYADVYSFQDGKIKTRQSYFFRRGI